MTNRITKVVRDKLLEGVTQTSAGETKPKVCVHCGMAFSVGEKIADGWCASCEFECLFDREED